MSMMPYHVYGSGDAGSRDLLDVFIALNIPYEFKDIRTLDKGVRINLIRLLDRRLHRVPQVFGPDGLLVGNFEAAVSHLKELVSV